VASFLQLPLPWIPHETPPVSTLPPTDATAMATRTVATVAGEHAEVVDELVFVEEHNGLDMAVPEEQAPSPVASTTATHATTGHKAPETAQPQPVRTPVGGPAWADELGSRLTFMVEQGRHTASLRLSPEHLGPLEINIVVQDDQASVWFGAAHADTRAAIEHALPRLRELFASQGLSLADTGVFHEAPRQQPQQAPGATTTTESEPSGRDQAVAARVRLGLIDAYA
jgi:flagellar hook-length control protein FliK